MLKRYEIKALQAALQATGLFYHTPTGEWDDNTTQAYQQFHATRLFIDNAHILPIPTCVTQIRSELLELAEPFADPDNEEDGEEDEGDSEEKGGDADEDDGVTDLFEDDADAKELAKETGTPIVSSESGNHEPAADPVAVQRLTEDELAQLNSTDGQAKPVVPEAPVVKAPAKPRVAKTPVVKAPVTP